MSVHKRTLFDFVQIGTHFHRVDCRDGETLTTLVSDEENGSAYQLYVTTPRVFDVEVFYELSAFSNPSRSICS